MNIEQLTFIEPPRPADELDAYLACALTGLDGDQRQLVFHVSEMVSELCAAQGIALYEPRKKTDPVHDPDVSDSEVYQLDRQRVASSDLLIHLCHFPSTGSGQELEIAAGALAPIILVSHAEKRVSRMITGVSAQLYHLRYDEPEDLRDELGRLLASLRPDLRERRWRFREFHRNVVGHRIRHRREEMGLALEELAAHTEGLTPRLLAQLEDSTDIVGNPTLIQLKEIARVLETTVGALVELELTDPLLIAARHGVSDRDRDAIARRVRERLDEFLAEGQAE